MWEPITFRRPDQCPTCRGRIEIYDFFNNPLDYQFVMDLYMAGRKGVEIKKAIYQMRCSRCKRVYPIIWKDGFPFPDCRDYPLEKHFNNLYMKGG